MAYLTIGGKRLYYEEAGIPDGPPLVLLHGFNGSGAFWIGQLAAFGARYRLLIPDWRGHGRTDNPGGRAAMNHRQFARDIIALCRTLGLGRAAFCGESSGAMLLLTLALEAPALARACILAGATYFYGDDLRTWWSQQTPDTVVSTAEQVQALQATHTALVQLSTNHDRV